MAFDGYSMNKQHQAHMSGKSPEHGSEGSKGGHLEDKSGEHRHPNIHIHSHSKGHTVHVMHSNGQHEQTEHEAGDAEGIANVVHQHIGAAGGQPVASENNMQPMEEEEFD
jgi:hypothetical protein